MSVLYPQWVHACAALLLGTLLLPAVGWTQGSRTAGSIEGAVTDLTEGVLPGAMVTAVEVDRGFSREAVTDGTGAYRLIEVPPGTYRVTIALSGFTSFFRDGVVVALGRASRVDAVLQLGGA